MMDNVFVYFCNAAGRIIPAPDTRMLPEQCGLDPRHWRRCEAVGAREIERVSLLLSKQLWEEKKARHVTQTLRELAFLQQREASARLRRAVNFSPADAVMNDKLEQKWKRKQEEALAVVYSEFDETKRHTALDMELQPASTSPSAQIFRKRQGVAS